MAKSNFRHKNEEVGKLATHRCQELQSTSLQTLPNSSITESRRSGGLFVGRTRGGSWLRGGIQWVLLAAERCSITGKGRGELREGTR